MSYVRHYVMRAATGEGHRLGAALADLRDAVATLPGSLGVLLLRDRADADRFVFIERWTSQEDHAAAGGSLPKPLMSAIMGATGAPPESAGLDEM